MSGSDSALKARNTSVAMTARLTAPITTGLRSRNGLECRAMSAPHRVVPEGARLDRHAGRGAGEPGSRQRDRAVRPDAAEVEVEPAAVHGGAGDHVDLARRQLEEVLELVAGVGDVGRQRAQGLDVG